MSRVEDAEECKNKGNEFLQKGDFDKAIEWYTQAINFHKSHVYYSNRSAAYLAKGFAETAAKDAETCIQMNPSWPKGYGRKGAALHKLRQYEKAIKAYEDGLKVAPGDAALEDGLQQVKSDMEAERNPSFASRAPPDLEGEGGMQNMFGALFGPDLFPRIESSPKLSKYLSDPSYVQIMKSLQQNPKALNMYLQDPRVLETISEMLGIGIKTREDEAGDGSASQSSSSDSKKSNDSSNGRSEQAPPAEETEEQKAARELKEKADAFKTKGNEHYKKKEFTEAIAEYEKALELIPTEITYILNISSVKLEQGDLAGCIEQCQKAIDVGRANQAPFQMIAKAYERMGNAQARHNNNKEALNYYRKAQVEYHNPALDATMKKIEKKIKEDEEQAYIDPAKGVEAKERGNELFKEGKYPESVKEYTEAVRRDPKNPVYYSNRAAAYIKLMDFGRAKEDCNKAIELDPKFVRAYARRGNVEYAVKEYKKAMESFRQGLELDPENEECKEGLKKVSIAVSSTGDERDLKERQQRAFEDPEIRAIMQDPVMIQVLRDMSTDPKAATKHMSDPKVAAKIEKLIAAGIVSTR